MEGRRREAVSARAGVGGRGRRGAVRVVGAGWLRGGGCQVTGGRGDDMDSQRDRPGSGEELERRSIDGREDDEELQALARAGRETEMDELAAAGSGASSGRVARAGLTRVGSGAASRGGQGSGRAVSLPVEARQRPFVDGQGDDQLLGAPGVAIEAAQADRERRRRGPR